jgi:hypothetical protein
MRTFLHDAFVRKPWLWILAVPAAAAGWWLAGKWL